MIKREIKTKKQLKNRNRSKKRSVNASASLSKKGRPKKDFMSYKQAQRFIKTQGTTTLAQFQKWSKLKKRPANFPSAPWRIYKTQWKNWGKFLGTGRTRKKDFMSYKQAQQYIIKQGVTTLIQFQNWRKLKKRPNNFPFEPAGIYKTQWKNWGKFLGTGRTRKKDFMSYKQAQRFIKKQKITTLTGFRKWRKSTKRPNNFPSNPWRTYKTEWKGWKKFLNSLSLKKS